jgi:hypothetical protein
MERAKDIIAHMETALETAERALQDTREAMIKSANKKRKEVAYNPGDLVFLSRRNIKTTRLSKKLDDKIPGSVKVLKDVGTSYRFQLPITIRTRDVSARASFEKLRRILYQDKQMSRRSLWW